MAMNAERGDEQVMQRHDWENSAVQEQLAAIEASLLGQLTDERYGSGVSSAQRSTDLEFIQMTGLTRSLSAEPVSKGRASPFAGRPRPTPGESMDLPEPVSFYEAGIEDVDHRAGPGGLDEEFEPPSADSSAPLGPGAYPGRSRSAEALRELIADLTREESPPPATLSEAATLETAEAQDSAQTTEEVWPEEEEVAAAPLRQPEAPLAFEEMLPTAPEASDSPAFSGDATTGSKPPALHEDASMPGGPREASSLDSLIEELSREEASESALASQISQPSVERKKPDAAPVKEGGLAAWQPASAPTDESRRDRFAAAPERQLIEAEELLQELEQQVRDSVSASTDWEEESLVATPSEEAEEAEFPDITGAQHHARRVYRRSRRRLFRRGALLAILAGFAYAAYYGVANYVVPNVQSASALYAEAERFMARGAHEEAATRWQLFARRYPDHADRPEAQFQAALAYFSMQPGSDDAARDSARRALALFEEFIQSNPGHRRSARAACMMGVLYYRLGQYDQVVRCLRPQCEPKRRGEDPEMVLPALRTLARAYARMGDYQTAEESYLDAASLTDNLTSEVDYYELGNLCVERAQAASDAAEKRQLQEKAASYWDRAAMAPGIDPQARERIRGQRQALLDQLEAAPAQATAAETITAPATSPEAPEMAPVSAEGQEVDPTAEAAQLQSVSAADR